MKRTNKFIYYYVLQGHYKQWEDLTAADTRQEIRSYRKDYRENEPETPTRIIYRRELNPERINTHEQA